MDATRSFILLFPLLAGFIYRLRNSLIRAYSVRLRLKFLRRCLQEQVIPKSLLPLRLRSFSDYPFSEYSALTLKKHIELTKRSEFLAFKKLKTEKWNFHCAIPQTWKQSLLDSIYSLLRERMCVLQNHLDNKLNYLISISLWKINSNCNNVVNLSSKNISQEAEEALGYGLSFSVTSRPSVTDISSSLSRFEKTCNIPIDHISIVKGLLYSSISLPFNVNFPLRYKKALYEIKRDPDLKLTKADKSNSLVVLDTNAYSEKMNVLLSDSSTYMKLNKNPLDDVIKNFNKNLKNILKNSQDILKKVSVVAPSLPYMYGLVKTHKTGNPMRPIISSTGSITYKLARYLVNLLSPLLGTISNSHLKNSLDLVNKLSSVNFVSTSKLISFDVTSLFTKVPVHDLLDYLRATLDNYDLPLNTSAIIQLISLCVIDCKFEFQGNYYKQVFGMAMGNPLSPLLSNLYMEFFESNLLPSISLRPIAWFRYVDDILAVISDNFEIPSFLDSLNNLVPSIKFTSESETDNTLPFLDVVIHRNPSNVKFSTYRKPTNNLSYVHFYSSHTKNVKMSVFSSMFLRALRIVSPEYFDLEIDKIKQIGHNLCYPDVFLEKCFAMAKKTFHNGSVRDVNSTSQSFKNVLVLPYFVNFEHVVPLLRQLSIKVVFNFRNNLQSFLIKNSPNNNKNIVYSIPCKHCKAFYIGQTTKGIDVRISQHKQSVFRGSESNALFVHMNNHSHGIDWNHSKYVCCGNDYIRRNIFESFLIAVTNDQNVNLSKGLYTLDPIGINLFRSVHTNVIKKLTEFH